VLWRGLAMRLPFRFLFRALLLELLLCVSAVGDEWPSPQVREVFSKARSYFVRVTPGQSWGGYVRVQRRGPRPVLKGRVLPPRERQINPIS